MELPGTTVLVRKHSFLSALATGFFGLLTTVVISATVLGGLGLYVANKQLSMIVTDLPNGLANWRNLPWADAFDDRPAPEYRNQIKLDARIVPAGEHRRSAVLVVDVSNVGDQTLSLLELRATVTDADGVPLDTEQIQAATPLSIDDDWVGPLLPTIDGQVRTFARRIQSTEAAKVRMEIVDLRIKQPRGRDSDSAGESSTPG